MNSHCIIILYQVQSDVGDVRQALTVNQEPIMPPPPDMSRLQLEGIYCALKWNQTFKKEHFFNQNKKSCLDDNYSSF